MSNIYFKLIVYGLPATAGSKKPFTYMDKKTGKIRASLAPDNKRQKPWMQNIAGVARCEYQGPPLRGAVKYEARFYFKRPKSHYGTGRNSDCLKNSAPRHHTKKPDSSKLARAAEDALTGIIWHDDSQCHEIKIDKFYGTPERMEIDIWIMVG